MCAPRSGDVDGLMLSKKLISKGCFYCLSCLLLFGGHLTGCRNQSGSESNNDAISGRSQSEPAIITRVGGRSAEIYRTRCATCHGTSGKGDGVAAVGLRPAPRSFQDRAWQLSVTDDHLRTVIVHGGRAVGKSSLMVANPDLASRRAELDGLVRIIRGLNFEAR